MVTACCTAAVRSMPTGYNLPRGQRVDADASLRVRTNLTSQLTRGPLTGLLAVICAWQLATWIPHYLTWPLWADHDVFATMALAWDAGELPYRDFLSNNFPGTTYLFWLIGRSAGWGSSISFHAIDVLLLIGLGGMLLLWSRRCFASMLAGMIGYASVLTYYLSLDFSQAAQRDWHGSVLVICGVLLIQAYPTRAGRIGSALVMALAVTIRPHTLLFLPAMLLTIAEPRGTERLEPAKVIEWSGAFAVFLVLGFVPLLWSGVFDDLLRSLPVEGYREWGGTPWERTEFTRSDLRNWRLLGIPACLLFLLVRKSDSTTRRLGSVWLVAFTTALLYEPLSPMRHKYLTQPLWLMWCVNVGLVGHWISTARLGIPLLRLVALVLLLSISVVPTPRFCSVAESLRAVSALRGGDEGMEPPPGYMHTFSTVPLYPWADYRALLDHIRQKTDVSTRVANLLHGVAVTGPTARHSVFPAESTTWLDMVSARDESRFIAALETTTNAVAVWAPGDERTRPRSRLASAIVQFYTPEVRFGSIEVWRRR